MSGDNYSPLFREPQGRIVRTEHRINLSLKDNSLGALEWAIKEAVAAGIPRDSSARWETAYLILEWSTKEVWNAAS